MDGTEYLFIYIIDEYITDNISVHNIYEQICSYIPFHKSGTGIRNYSSKLIESNVI